jgi:asparagine synthase (glutamine-hydrolysing)
MCGIAGVWSKNELNIARIESGLKLLCHRGPDDQKYKTFNTKNGMNAALLFTRLAIIDLDPRANQPMGYGGLWLTFNGEIYNYREIRKELEEQGLNFHTTSDTEVLLKGLHTYGWNVLNKLEGMWALAVYDENTNRLTLCRDRFGEKPLSYIKSTEGVFYASEVRVLQQLSGQGLVPNKLQLQRFLVNGYKSLYKTNETFFDGVIDVPAKTLLHFNDDGTVNSEVYWKPNLEIDEEVDFNKAVIKSKEKLLRSLDLRLRSDVPIAFSLSGGIDSVALVSLAKRELGADFHAFTVDIPDDRYNETQSVKRVVADLGIKHSFLDLTNRDLITDLNTIIKHRKTPVLTLSSYMQWLLMSQISNQGYKVVIGGIGADEIFTGYYDHHLYYIAQLPKKLRYEAINNWKSKVKPFVQNPFLSDPNLFIHKPNFREYIYLDSGTYETYMLDEFHENFKEKYLDGNLLRNRMMNEVTEETIPTLLHEEDLNSMYFSMENRSPYLDRLLFETLYGFPTNKLIDNGFAKSILRELVRGIAPDYIIDNTKKIGFNAPIENFLNLNDVKVNNYLLEDSLIFEIVDRRAIEKFLSRRKLSNSESKFLFAFISTKIMLQNSL